MGVGALCTVTVTGTVTGIPIGPLVVQVPMTDDGLIDVTIPLGGLLGDLVLVNIPCPTIDDIEIVVGDVVSLTISVTEG
ncbi:hypothetical protein [Metabacillus niabensis]|uniref:hypothetical protein n=1 Tax=Metabacillus niabensis TaxID=324854 RepID=UPI001CF98C0E|nr:hypothetical protein [Metabacillus niabensis]